VKSPNRACGHRDRVASHARWCTRTTAQLRSPPSRSADTTCL